MKMRKPIFVTKPYLPPYADYEKYVRSIWRRRQLTNNGPLVLEFEKKLKSYLGVKHAFFVSNGTIAIQIALKALNITGEVITTPFTYVATTNAILWEKATPVFGDIDPKTLMLDPTKIEKLITKKTQAILAVHVYGYPAHVLEIERIAKKHKLRVIYDGAHGFGSTLSGKSLLSFGDVTTLSFHATKLFHTGEGGAVVTDNDEIAEKLSEYRSFGQKGADFVSDGINAKNSELHAAMGLVNLEKIEMLIARRKKQSELYDEYLRFSGLLRPAFPQELAYNHSYYPVVFPTRKHMQSVKATLESKQIFPRQYFYPSLNTLSYVPYTPCPVSEDIATRVLCLPLYHQLSKREIKHVSSVICVSLRKLQGKRAKPKVFVERKNMASLFTNSERKQQVTL